MLTDEEIDELQNPFWSFYHTVFDHRGFAWALIKRLHDKFEEDCEAEERNT